MSETSRPQDAEKMQQIVNECLRPQAPAIATIGFTGDVAVVLHAPSEDGKARARAIGWDGTSEVFRLTGDGKRALEGFAGPLDVRLAKWLGRKFEPASPVARILLLTGDDALLVNFSPFGGWSLEPAAAAGPLPS